MKAIIALCCAVLLSSNAVAAVKCAPDGKGGMCCWDTVKDGPFKPITC